MKVLLIGPHWTAGWLPAVERSLRQLGHTPYVSRYYPHFAPRALSNKIEGIRTWPAGAKPPLASYAQKIGAVWERYFNERLVRIGKSLQPDLVLILKGETVHASTLASLHSRGCRIASWWVDDPILYFANYPQVRAQLEHIDSLFVFDRGRFDQLRSLGASQLEYLPCAYDASVYYPRVASARDARQFHCDVALVANYYPERGELLSKLHGLDVAIWGAGWQHTAQLQGFPATTLRAKKLRSSKVPALYAVAKVCPNAHHAQTLLGGLNMRTFEIPAAGGFELVDRVPGIEDLFDVGRELIVYDSPGHFRELTDHYLAHPEERTAIIEKGRARAARDHTFESRLRVIFKSLENL